MYYFPVLGQPLELGHARTRASGWDGSGRLPQREGEEERTHAAPDTAPTRLYILYSYLLPSRLRLGNCLGRLCNSPGTYALPALMLAPVALYSACLACDSIYMLHEFSMISEIQRLESFLAAFPSQKAHARLQPILPVIFACKCLPRFVSIYEGQIYILHLWWHKRGRLQWHAERSAILCLQCNP